MKLSPGARSWIAAGVRHELLMRALPALRHDMTTPVSVMRMALLLLKRQAAAETFDAEAWKERTDLIEKQVSALSAGVGSLADWELSTRDDGITRSALVAQCTALMRTAFELGGVTLQVGDGLLGEENEPRFPSSAALRYMLLGALGFLHDTVPELGAIQVDADGPDALSARASHGSTGSADPMAVAHRAPRSLAIDSVALQSLAEGLGYDVKIERDAVRIALLSPNKD